jgi:hypothetical protein
LTPAHLPSRPVRLLLPTTSARTGKPADSCSTRPTAAFPTAADGCPSMEFLGSPATSQQRSDVPDPRPVAWPSNRHRACLPRLCCPLVVSHDLEAFFRASACGSVSCRSRP